MTKAIRTKKKKKNNVVILIGAENNEELEAIKKGVPVFGKKSSTKTGTRILYCACGESLI